MKAHSLVVCMVAALIAVPLASAQDDGIDFMGRWALDLPGGAGWLEVHDRPGFMDASVLWYGGSVVPVSSINVSDGKLRVTRVNRYVRDAKDGSQRRFLITITLEISQEDGALAGTAFVPNRSGMGRNIIRFTGERIPDLPPAPDLSAIQYGESQMLFNGEDLSGWSLTIADQENGWMVEEAVLINNPVQPEGGDHVSYGNLRTDGEFEDFKLTLEVNVPEGSNSGIYLRGIYEIQVADTYGKSLDSHNMGGLYSRITPSVAAERPAGEWQSFDITLYRRHLTVVLNGTTIIDNQPVLGVTGGALTADEFKPGPIYLQGDHGRVLYRNIVLRPIIE